MNNFRGIGLWVLMVLLSIGQINAEASNNKAVVGDADPIIFTLGDIVGMPGDVVCVPITVENFDNVVSIQFSFNYDPSVLSYTGFLNPNTLIGLGAGNFNVNDPNGFINFVWFDPNVGTTGGVTLPDGTEIFSLCFQILGDPNQEGNLTITGTPLAIEVTQVIDNQDCTNDEIIVVIGDTDITCGDFDIYPSVCSTPAGDDMGTISFYVCGGVAPYSYNIGALNGVIAADFDVVTETDLPPGVYSITVIDDTGAPINSGPLEIVDAPPILIDPVIIPPSCFGEDDGEVEITISGGVPIPGADPYEISWSTNQYNTTSIDDLVSGTYFVTVADANNCESVLEMNLNVDQINIDIVVNASATCLGLSDGSATATASGGTPFGGGEYEYRWNSVPQLFEQGVNSTNPDIPVGMWVVRVTDSEGCTAEMEFEMTPSKELDTDINVTDVLCFGDSTGSATIQALTIGAETAPYSFLAQHEDGTFVFGPVNPANNTCTKNDLPAGIYNVTIQDNVGCMLDTIFEVLQPDELIVDLIPNLDCSDPDSGTVLAEVTGGVEDYTYLWSNGDMDSLLDGVMEDIYMLTVTDDNLCTQVETVNLTISGSLVIDSFTVNHIDCFGDQNGAVTVHVTGSGGNLNFDWGAAGMGQSIGGLPAGRYYINVSDDSGCSAFDSIDILEPEPFLLTANLNSPSCPGESNGNIGVMVEGGTPPYTYDWDFTPDPGLPLLPGLSEGMYGLIVTDSNNCVIDTILNLMDPPSILVDVTNISGVSCVDQSPGDGQATATASGGAPMGGAYNYIWSSTEFESGITSTALLLESGEQWVIATDGVCASDTVFFNLMAPERISLDLPNSSFTDPLCFGGCNGTATVEATGGIGPYSFTWLGSGNVGATENDLCAGKHYVLIMDSNNCQVLDSIELSQPDSLSIEIDPFATFNINCFDGATGVISTVQSGGNPGPFIYTWTDNVSDGTSASELTIGTYVVTVTDVLGCMDTAEYEIMQADPIVPTIPTPQDPGCFGEQTCITVTDAIGGGGPNYKFTINNGPQFPLDSCINVFAGTYTLSVFDKDGCAFDTIITINQPPELTVDLGPDISVALGEENIELFAAINSITPIDTVIWFPTDSTFCIDPECTRLLINPTTTETYTVTVLDDNGCIAIDEILVDVGNNRNIYIPNAFTPNGDGINDIFQIYAGAGVEEIIFFKIFDRWGNMVHNIDNPIDPIESGTGGWNGRFGNQELSPAVFTYIAKVKFIDGNDFVYRGGVTLIR